MDCQEAIDDNDLSSDEDTARTRLIKVCQDIADQFNENE